ALLEKVVSNDGLVDYAALQLEQTALEEYLAELARVAPDTHKHLFPTDEDELAYWINAHNSCVLRAVIRFNPPPSFDEVGGRFDHTEFFLGNKSYSLVGMVALIRRRFPEPRNLFTLPDARRGGPRFTKDAYMPAKLDEQIEKTVKAFVNDD